MTSKTILALALLVLAALGLLGLTACPTLGSNPLASLETMPEQDFNVLEARADLVTRVLGARLIQEGALTQAQLDDAARALKIAAGDPLALAGSNVLTEALERAGFTNQEALLALVLVEDFLRSKVSWGPAGSPIGPRARRLLETLAGSLEAAGRVDPTDAEKAKAAELVPETVKDPR